ncbi:hypothetical protein ACSBR2_031063 [Camellia fascicularis]
MSEPVPNPPIPPQNQIYEAIRIFDPFPTHSIQGLGSRRTRQTSDITGNIVSRNSCSYCSDRQHRHNTARIGTKDELFRLLPHEDLPNSVVLVFANKQDPCGDN